MATSCLSLHRLHHHHRLHTHRGLLPGGNICLNPLRGTECMKGLTRCKLNHPATTWTSIHCLLGTITVTDHYRSQLANSSHELKSMQSLANSIQENSGGCFSHLIDLQGLAMVADLDAETAKLAAVITGPFLSAFGFLFILRIVMSWYPKLPVEKFPYALAYAPTEPFLSITRKIIPPLGGVDVTPVVWFGVVSFLNEILVGRQGLLVLLSQQA